MARIPITSGFQQLPEGWEILRIYDATYDETFGKIVINLVNADGVKHTERYSIQDANGGMNEKALNAFSYFAKTALNEYDIEDIDITDLIGHYIEAEVVHNKVESNKEPGKMLTFVNLGQKKPASGFDRQVSKATKALFGETEEVTQSTQQASSNFDLNSLLS